MPELSGVVRHTTKPPLSVLLGHKLNVEAEPTSHWRVPQDWIQSRGKSGEEKLIGTANEPVGLTCELLTAAKFLVLPG